MRVLKIFFNSILLLIVFGLIGGLISREILLSVALRQVKGDMKFLSQSANGSGDFFKDCLEYSGSFSNEGALIRNQIRFVSDSSYVIESVCQASESVRKVIKNKSLPPLVRRVVGGSGLVQGADGHGLELSIFGRSGVVYEYENIIFTSTNSKVEDLNIVLNEGPASVCGGYGYVCCNENFQSGKDFYQPAALDCPRSCYASCTEKPVVLTFNSEPASNEAKVVSLKSGDFVEFVYTISDTSGDAFAKDNLFEESAASLSWSEKLLKILDKYSDQTTAKKDEIESITISFGDGLSEKLLDLHGRTQHTYTCEGKSMCVYNATIQATTKAGVISSLDGVSKIQIQVRN